MWGGGRERERDGVKEGRRQRTRQHPMNPRAEEMSLPLQWHHWDRSQTSETESFVVLPDRWDHRKLPKRLAASITKTQKGSGRKAMQTGTMDASVATCVDR